MKLKGAKIVTESLINEGVDTVFCYPGGAVLTSLTSFIMFKTRLGKF